MLSLLWLRALFLLRVAPRAPARLSVFLRAPLPAFYSTAPGNGPIRHNVCFNCRREGHLAKYCKEPTICIACGVEGHLLHNCPKPDPVRLEALKTRPTRCFRCGELSHAIGQCPQPPKVQCFSCGQTGHSKNQCRTRPNRATGRAPPPPVPPSPTLGLPE